MNVPQLQEYIDSYLFHYPNADEKASAYDRLAAKIAANSEMSLLIPAFSGFTPDERIIFDKVFEIMEKKTKNFEIDPMSMHGAADEFGGSDFPPICTPEEEAIINQHFHMLEKEEKVSFSPGEVKHFATSTPAQEDQSWIQTFSGKKFYPTNPNHKDICIEDIAHALSLQCRFTGHCKFHYSIAQHSILVSLYCEPEYALQGLLHDASEAYICDLAAPLKKSGHFEDYKEIENDLQMTINAKFGLEYKEPANIKETDLRMLATEARDLMGNLHPDWVMPAVPFGFRIERLSPRAVEHQFLYRFYQLTDI